MDDRTESFLSDSVEEGLIQDFRVFVAQFNGSDHIPWKFV